MTDEPTNIREWWEKHKDENGVAFMPLKLHFVNGQWEYVGHISGPYYNLKPLSQCDPYLKITDKLLTKWGYV
jgi:hypothetical protein